MSRSSLRRFGSAASRTWIAVSLAVSMVATGCANSGTSDRTQAPSLQPGTATPAAAPSATAGPSASQASGALMHESAQLAALAFDGDIYDVPDPLPAGERGKLIRLQTTLPDDLRLTVRLYRMLYHSRAMDGSDIAVSGTLWVPVAAPRPDGYPIVSFGAGTHNHFSDACPYSNFDAWNPDEYNFLLDRFLAAGYVVAYTDWHGLGTRYPYPYAVGEAQTRALFDAARAARDLLGPDASDDVLLVGHSVGADGVMAALKFGPDYDDGLDIRGAVVVDGAPGHRTVVANVMAAEEPDAALLMFGVLGYTRAYPELKTSDVLTPAAIANLAFFDEAPCNTDPPFGVGPRAEMIKTNPLSIDRWRLRIDAGLPAKPSYPVFYPVADGEPDLDARIAAGRRVDAEIVHYAAPIDHYSIIIEAADEYLTWLEARL